MLSHCNYHPSLEGPWTFYLRLIVGVCSSCDIRHRRPYLIGGHFFNLSLCCCRLDAFHSMFWFGGHALNRPRCKCRPLSNCRCEFLFHSSLFSKHRLLLLQWDPIDVHHHSLEIWLDLVQPLQQHSVPLPLHGRLAGIGASSAAAFCSPYG